METKQLPDYCNGGQRSANSECGTLRSDSNLLTRSLPGVWSCLPRAAAPLVSCGERKPTRKLREAVIQQEMSCITWELLKHRLKPHGPHEGEKETPCGPGPGLLPGIPPPAAPRPTSTGQELAVPGKALSCVLSEATGKRK